MKYPDVDYTQNIAHVLSQIAAILGTKFVIVIDEWDCVVRNLSNKPELVHQYLQFLHALFKSEESQSFLALVYITGILPIKKIKDESALNNFREFTMMNSRVLTPYFGFTEDEVKALCEEHNMSFETMRDWYDGYLINGYLGKDADRVAEILELSHETYTSIRKYNDENSLACAITMAYFTAPAYYTVIRELPSSKGFADFAFIPRADTKGKPAMIVELKWDQSADSAINQIKERRYTGALRGYDRNILLVGINYDKDSNDKKHKCVIEEIGE